VYSIRPRSGVVRVNLARGLKPHKGKDAVKTKRISKVTIKRMTDTDPDTSYLGHYSDRAKTDYAIDRRHSLDCPINSGTEGKLLWYSSGNGRIELQMTMEQAESASHSGDCNEDTRELFKVPAIADQLAKIAPTVFPLN
jgi:hypothetical protein